jgi:histidyl-tRNA synthetase
MANIPFPRGVRDLMPNEALFRNELLAKVENVFKRFGFLAIDTPTFESLKILKAKGAIGEDAKLLYETNEDLGLRYDFTVSLARYMSMHQDLPLPFRRYYIGKSWRREEPQRLRYREFTQADVDIVGGRGPAADAEVIAAPCIILEELGIDYTVLISNRKIIEQMLGSFGVKQENFIDVMRIVDKLDKVGEEAMIERLNGLGLGKDIVRKIGEFISTKGSNEDKLAYVGAILKEGDGNTAVGELKQTLELLAIYGLKGTVSIDFSLMRGFDYYTDIVMEIKANTKKTKASIGGGGRYDKLIELYGGKSLPAVGLSLGIDRILELLGFSDSVKYTYAKAFIINVKDKNYPYALKVANFLRANGIAVDINVATRNISNQLAYANSLKVGFAIIVGDEEEKGNKLKLRDLVSGQETMMAMNDVLARLKGI